MLNRLISFSFLVVAYNHEKYIIEHLESIKFLIKNFARDINIKLIINDDCSTDNTVKLIDLWLQINSDLFIEIVKLYNDKNCGTCRSVLNMLDYIDTDAAKLTAGDDIYSFENIFEHALLSSDISIRSGIPLNLVDRKLNIDKIDVFNIIATTVIYRNAPLINRVKLLSNINAPNISYNVKYLKSNSVRGFLSKFDVVEDWPIQVALSENYPKTKFDLIDKVFVYYRRTPGSTFVVANNRFLNDKARLFDYLANNENELFYKIMIRNRKFLFLINNKYYNKLFNISFYVYILMVFLDMRLIYRVWRNFKPDIGRHNAHYSHIYNEGKRFLIKYYHLNSGSSGDAAD